MALQEIEKCVPFASPINCLDELLEWHGEDDYYVGVAPLEPCQRDNLLPKTLVCHDMAGGYLDDRFVQGSARYDAYRFYHWHMVDTFVYFSHHMITIPPPCWINAAHKHAVPVLGTFITEWDEGFKKCTRLFSDRNLIDQVITKMVELCVHHSMDGWLINIENEIDVVLLPNVLYFLNRLTERMHLAIAGSQVVWYDSVTITGRLEWQNELNELNKPFFDQCDAIFLNYTWKEDNLARSASNCGSRLHDVYVGIDVFGRGMIGGGGYNTKEAVSLARRSDLSVALFAPGWVYEVNGSREFDANEQRFWYYLQPYLPMHTACNLPLATSFCQGWGQYVYLHGQIVSEEPWSNLSMQQLQPTLAHDELGYNPHQQYKWLHLQDGYIGGGAMRFIGVAPENGQPITFKIFDTSIPMDTSLYVSFKIKHLPVDGSTKVFLYLTLNKDEVNEVRLLLPEEDLIETAVNWGSNDLVLQSLTSNDIPKALKMTVEEGRTSQWTSRVFQLSADILEGKVLHEVGLLAYSDVPESSKLNVLLGAMQVLSCMDETLEPMSVSNLCCADSVIEATAGNGKCLSLKLQWSQPDIAADIAAYHIWYSINGDENIWLGSTYTNKFYVSSLFLEEHGVIRFTVQCLYKSVVLEDINQACKLCFEF